MQWYYVILEFGKYNGLNLLVAILAEVKVI